MATTPSDAGRIDALERAVFGDPADTYAAELAERHTRAQLDELAADRGIDTTGEPNKLAAAAAILAAA